MVTVPYYNDPHQQAYFDYLNYMARREREEEERKRQEEEGGGGWGAGIGAGAGALGGFLVGGPIGAGIGASIGGKAGGAIGTAIDPPGGPVGAARNQAWQQGIGTLTDLGVTAATWADMQAPHEAPGTAPSFMETYAAQQGRGGLGGLYAERRRSERQMGLLQERDRARQQYIDSMRGVGYEVVPSGRAIQDRYDEISAILKNEANLSPLQLEQVVNPADGEGYTFTDRGGWKQITSNAKNKLAAQKQEADEKESEQKHILDAYKQAEQTLPLEATPWQIENKAREILDIAKRIQSGEPLPPRPPPVVGKTTPVPPAKPEAMGWYDRAKLAASIPMNIMAGAGAPQRPGPPGAQAPSPVQQTADQLLSMVESLGGNVSEWPKEAREQGKILAERFQAELEAQFGDPKNTPASLLPVLEIVAKLL
jgi:hypothetical protein